MIRYRFYTALHRGSLVDSLKTRRLIEEDDFNDFLKKGYHFYAFDDRINSFIFICNNLEEFTKKHLPHYLEIEIIVDDKFKEVL